MSEFKGTRGNAIFINDDVEKNYCVWVFGEKICSTQYYFSENNKGYSLCSKKKAEANANLIVDAFKVRQQINCELSELKNQRDEMLEMLENIFDYSPYEIEQLIKKVKNE
jgi:hypothetical protein